MIFFEIPANYYVCENCIICEKILLLIKMFYALILPDYDKNATHIKYILNLKKTLNNDVLWNISLDVKVSFLSRYFIHPPKKQYILLFFKFPNIRVFLTTFINQMFFFSKRCQNQKSFVSIALTPCISLPAIEIIQWKKT